MPLSKIFEEAQKIYFKSDIQNKWFPCIVIRDNGEGDVYVGIPNDLKSMFMKRERLSHIPYAFGDYVLAKGNLDSQPGVVIGASSDVAGCVEVIFETGAIDTFEVEDLTTIHCCEWEEYNAVIDEEQE